MLNPQEKITLEIQPSINTETKMNLQTEIENEIAIGNEMQNK